MGVLRSRQVGVDQSQLAAVRTAMAQGRPGRLRLNLFPDVDLNVGIERTGDTRFGYSLSGRIGGQPHGSVTVVVSGKLLAGVVHSRQGTYTIRFPERGHSHDPGDYRGIATTTSTATCPARRSGETRVAPSATASVGDDGSEVDLLVLFTEAALAFEGGLPQMRASIDLAVAYANDAYAASGVEFQLNLVAAVQVDHEESTSPWHCRSPEPERGHKSTH